MSYDATYTKNGYYRCTLRINGSPVIVGAGRDPLAAVKRAKIHVQRIRLRLAIASVAPDLPVCMEEARDVFCHAE